MNNLEETDRKNLIMKRKEKLEICEETRKNCRKKFALMIQKSTAFPREV